MFRLYCLIAAGLAISMVGPADAGSAPKPAAQHLLTGWLTNPLGIDTPEPGFSWRFVQDARGSRQSAYRVQVADSLDSLKAAKPNVWDSSKVASSRMQIVLKDKPLASGARYYWRVKVWDASGAEGGWSAPAWFEMGILCKSDWHAEWLNSPGDGNGYHTQFASDVNAARWVQIDLGQPTEFDAVKLFPSWPRNWQPDTPGFGFPVRYRLEASDDAGFSKPVLLADRTTEDQPNPGQSPVEIKLSPVKARYVRLTVTRLYTRSDGKNLFALAEMQVVDSQGGNLALGKPVTATDSIEDSGWSTRYLTGGETTSVQTVSAAPVFRHEFDLSRPVKWARAYVTGVGYYELHLNGGKVGDRVLDPGRTSFDKRVLYSTYDVTAQLKQGRNAAGVLLGKGWWSESPRFLLQINVVFADGTTACITSDKTWKRSTSPITENSLYNGETYDARLEQAGWDMPGFDDSTWGPAETVTSPTKTLSAQTIQPIRVCETIRPKSVTNLKPGVWVYDFGQNFSGWCRLKVSGPAGSRVTLKHAEVLHDDGTVNQENLRSAKATDVYVLKGKGAETYEPRFTYHGFRYVQVEGFPGKPDLDSLLGCVVHTDFEPHGSFQCSNPLINQIWKNAYWGYKTNFHSVPTDCPQRDERQGWMADGHMTADMGFYNFDMGPGYAKWLRDMQDAEGEDGAVPDTVPHIWGTNPGDPMWAAAYPFVAWDLYRHTGDMRILAQHYPGIRKYVDLLAREAKDTYILSRNNYGDWVGVVDTPKDLISTGGFYRCSWIVARMAEILGNRTDAKKYDALCAKIADAFNKKFFDPKTNNYGNASQYSNAWPLYLGIVSQDKHKAVVDNLINDIMVTRKGHLSTGFLGARYLLEVLCNEGRADVAYTIVTQKDYPGWGYMIEKGATTVWELWTYSVGNGMNSHNHPAFGFVNGWFYQALAGITPIAQPMGGFEGFEIRPHVVGDLTWAKASVDTVRGPVVSSWARTDDGIKLDVTIPGNSGAVVCVPKVGQKYFKITESGRTVWENGRPVPGAPGIKAFLDSGDWIEFDCGAGSYAFRLTSDK
jgi:alpha-L-rhamnosidase